MSHHAVRAVLERSRSRGLARLVLVIVAEHAGDAMTAYPSVAEIARLANAPRQSVMRVIDDLLRTGELVIAGTRARGNRIFQITLPPVASTGHTIASTGHTIAPEPVTPCDRTDDPTGHAMRPVADPHWSHGVTPLVTWCDTTGHMVLPEPSLTTIEPSEEEEERDGRSAASPDPVTAAVAAWNVLARRIGLPACQKLTPARRNAITARLAEAGGLEGWRQALARVEASPFLCGANPRGWRASLDFLARPGSFLKLMEGSYDPHPVGHPAPVVSRTTRHGPPRDGFVALLVRSGDDDRD